MLFLAQMFKITVTKMLRYFNFTSEVALPNDKQTQTRHKKSLKKQILLTVRGSRFSYMSYLV